MKYSKIKTALKEAATLKAQAQRLMRDIDDLLSNKEISDKLRKEVGDVRAELKRTWSDLAGDAQGPVVSVETAAIAEVIRKEGDEIVLYSGDETKVLGRYRFGKGEDYEDEDAARAAANKHESEVEYFKAHPKEEGEPVEKNQVKECGDEMAAVAFPFGAHSFADLQAAEQATAATIRVAELSHQFTMLGSLIMNDETVTDKVVAFKSLAAEFVALVTETLSPAAITAAYETDKPAPPPEKPPAKFAESRDLAEADAVTFPEIAEASTAAPRDPLTVEVKLIKPGWGNKRDNHYYGPDVLARDAHVFEGVKMYATDHKEGEKSERTEVSVIEKIERFDTDGSPVARVKIFDPAFAEKTRNREQSGHLQSLECSILAYGSAREGTAPDGRKGNIVESITSAQSVDWVTKAGAGGHALRLAECEANMEEQVQVETTPAAAPAPALLAEAQVLEALSKTSLPAASICELVKGQYADEAALVETIKTTAAKLVEATGSGQPVQPVTRVEAPRRTLTEVEDTISGSLMKYGLGPKRAAPKKGDK
jgi:hypothetical protein